MTGASLLLRLLGFQGTAQQTSVHETDGILVANDSEIRIFTGRLQIDTTDLVEHEFGAFSLGKHPLIWANAQSLRVNLSGRFNFGVLDRFVLALVVPLLYFHVEGPATFNWVVRPFDPNIRHPVVLSFQIVKESFFPDHPDTSGVFVDSVFDNDPCHHAVWFFWEGFLSRNVMQNGVIIAFNCQESEPAYLISEFETYPRSRHKRPGVVCVPPPASVDEEVEMRRLRDLA